MKFSLMFFSAESDSEEPNKYDLLLHCARFADKAGFHAIWTPERHFKAFGGLYPAPSLLASAIATLTERVQLRAGSVVLPLQNPLRVAEEWSIVDNLSNGRAGVSFAPGWNPDDFALDPSVYGRRKEIMYERIEDVRRLWRGESIPMQNGVGQRVCINILPKPIQAELPVWITAMGAPDTYRRAGEIGANLLTALIDQDLSHCAANIRLYKQALEQAGYDASRAKITLMLHTYVGENNEETQNNAKEPFIRYLRAFLATQVKDVKALCQSQFGIDHVSAQDEEAFFSMMYQRYLRHRALIGNVESCKETIRQVQDIGVNEVACLIDFGMGSDSVMASLPYLADLQASYRSMPICA